MGRFFLGLILCLVPVLGLAFDHRYQGYDKLLKDHVHYLGPQSTFDYDWLRQHPVELDYVLAEFSMVERSEFEAWEPNQKKAFLVNGHNAFCLKLVLDHYPVSSILDTAPKMHSPFAKPFFQLFGKKFTLDQIEAELAKAPEPDPRVHLALTRASLGGPNLPPGAYLPETLDEQLDESVKVFLTDPDKNQIQEGKLYLSKIFDWHEEAFREKSETLAGFLRPYWPEAARLIEKGKMKFRPYRWTLNDTRLP